MDKKQNEEKKHSQEKDSNHSPLLEKESRSQTTDYMSNVILVPLGSDPERDEKIMSAWRSHK